MAQKTRMKALLLTNEYPPHVYGGAGIHVEYLSRELARLCRVEVRCFGDQRQSSGSLSVKGFKPVKNRSTAPEKLKPVFGSLQRCLDFNTDRIDADVVHVHTWYTHFGGLLAKFNYGIPLVLTTHSLEPLRSWKREQLGGGYDFSCWVERAALEAADAIIAVSQETKKDILNYFDVSEKKVHVIYNGIDADEYRPVRAPDTLVRYGINPSKPYILFVGRITRQKGIIHLVNAIPHLAGDFQIVLCAGAPDTPEIAREMTAAIERVRKTRPGIVWIREMVDNPTKIALYSHASLFVCPSIYEPFGIINLEAMACRVPVVASSVGGIKEVVVDGKTGALVPVRLKKTSQSEPVNPAQFSQDLAFHINRLMADKALRIRMGHAGRRRVLKIFGWRAIAKQVHALYRSLQRPSPRN